MITRDVEVSAIADLALSPPRGSLAATVEDEILVLPARADPAAVWLVLAFDTN